MLFFERIIIIIIIIIIIKQVPRTSERNMCPVEAKGSTSDPDSNIFYGSNSKVTITKPNKTELTPEYIQLQKSVILGT